ncbi:hypothetical protein EBU71_21715, partial [bacterium]|nr:hypothetical protein [Candidatus Elulimicrobium humile]
GIKVSLINILWIKPLKISKKSLNNLKNSKFGGMVIDDDYTDGVAKSIANDLSTETKKIVITMGLKNKTAGFGKNKDNLPPSAMQIVRKIYKIVKNVF